MVEGSKVNKIIELPEMYCLEHIIEGILQMKKIVLLFVVLCSGCGFLTTEKPYQAETVEPPRVERTDDGYYIYSFPDDVSSVNTPVAPQVCEYSSTVLKTVTRKIKTGLLTGINKTVEKTYTFELDLDSDVDQALLRADHIHLTRAQLRVHEDSRGHLGFIEWIKTDLNDQIILWTDEPDGIQDEMNFDGSIDIRPEIRNNKITFDGRVRGSYPDDDIRLKILLEFVTLRECESVNQ